MPKLVVIDAQSYADLTSQSLRGICPRTLYVPKIEQISEFKARGQLCFVKYAVLKIGNITDLSWGILLRDAFRSIVCER